MTETIPTLKNIGTERNLLTEKERKDLITAALKAREHAYAPYSLFYVGSAILTEDGQIYSGHNIENASFSLCVCGERVAAINSIVHGHDSFKALCFIGSAAGFCYPCGACLNFLSEFDKSGNMVILIYRDNGEFKECYLKELFPHAFTNWA